jgi:hypothetical protein
MVDFVLVPHLPIVISKAVHLSEMLNISILSSYDREE